MALRVCFVIAAAFMFSLPVPLFAQHNPGEFSGTNGGSCTASFDQCIGLCRFSNPIGDTSECEEGCKRDRQRCCGEEKDACDTLCRLNSSADACRGGGCNQTYQQCLGDGSSGGRPGGGEGWGPSPKPYLPDAPGGPIPPLSNRPSPTWLEEIKGALCRCVNASELVFTENGAGVQWNGKRGYIIVGAGGCLENQRMFCQVGVSF